ncbi:MAG TPA: ADOP family duplicated permease [Gemmatimonadaceae bacterium]|nr:ADOP family duplicated permease [Gemmatimonadaceae bacterium]
MPPLSSVATWLEGALQDIRFAARSLRRSPGWTAVALLTMALGVGASTTVFQVADALLIRPIAYRDGDRVFRICREVTVGQEARCFGGLSPDGLRRLRATTHTIESIVLFDAAGRILEPAGRALSIDVALIDADFLPFTGRQPVIGRNFTAEEASGGAQPVLLLSEGLWRRDYGASANVLGKVVQVDSVRRTIIGVMPASASLPDFQWDRTDLWMPLGSDPLVRVRGVAGVAVRLKPGVASKTVEAEVATIDAQTTDDPPPKGIQSRWRLTRPQDHLSIRDSLVMVVGAVALLLLIACTNVAHLLLARGATRERELAIRHALGAGRSRLLRQLVAESMLLAAGGGALAMLIARGGVWLLGLTHPADMSVLSFVGTRSEVVSMASVLSLVAGLLIGLIAGLRSAHRHLAQSLRASASSAPLSTRRLRSSLIVGEVALSTTLLVGALLLIHAVVGLQRVPLGFNPVGLYSVAFTQKGCVGGRGAMPCIETPETRRMFAARLREGAARIPGLEQITVGRQAISGTVSTYAYETPERSTTGSSSAPTVLNEIAPDFFDVMEIRLVAGRTFDAGSAARNEVVVTRSLAGRLWPGVSPIGHQLRRAAPYPDGTIQPWQTVVGETPDVVRRVVDGAEPGLYLPLDNSRPTPGTGLIVRTRGRDPSPLLKQFATSIAANEMDVRITNVQQRLDQSIADPQFVMLILAIFAALGVVLASVGLFGVISYAVSQRTREIGIRMTLGATRAVIARLVVGDGLRLAVIGVLLGLAGATAATRLIQSMLYGVSRFDAISFVLAATGVLITSLMACALPMMRATGIDAAITLRAE